MHPSHAERKDGCQACVQRLAPPTPKPKLESVGGEEVAWTHASVAEEEPDEHVDEWDEM
eukprot:SAG25_NODE_745_length_5594_cov_2.305187_5_plen_59_part_00